ncbi:Predicted FxsA cytoplasmic membrane protein [gamma proteobacterium HdN1]|nr:Predicted FxsA cytoplasmic membrane protein [gamma proteobacterium HdN1]
MLFLRNPFWTIFVIALLESIVMAKMGSRIGWGFTIALLLLAAIVGSQLVRQQGFAILGRLQVAMARGESPSREMLNSGLIMMAGMLLIVPGFVSDALALLLLIPFFRRSLVSKMAAPLDAASAAARANFEAVSGAGYGANQGKWAYYSRTTDGRVVRGSGTIIDGEFTDLDVSAGSDDRAAEPKRITDESAHKQVPPSQ